MILVPEPIPIPQKATWFKPVDESAPELAGTTQFPQLGVEPVHVDDEGKNFVSLRFWQMKDDSPVPFAHESQLLLKAFAAMHPCEAGEADENVGKFDEIEDALETGERYRTVVEAVTFHSVDNAAGLGPLDRCVEALLNFHRAYRMRATRPLALLTRQRLFPLALGFSRAVDETEVAPLGLIALNGRPPELGGLVSEIDPTPFDHVVELQRRLDQYDPLVRFLESQTDAAYALHGQGSYRDAVIYFGIACEVLFDGLLGMLMWEEGVSVEAAAEVFSEPIVSRVKKQFHTRLRGTWKLDRGEVGDWHQEVAAIRNRVVHSGYIPLMDEALAAEAAASALRDFTANRLAATCSRYPFTAVTFFGDRKQAGAIPGLNRAARRWLEQNRGELAAKRQDHLEWRQTVHELISRRAKAL